MDKDGYHGYDKDAWRESASDYERGFIDGMQKQMQSSVDKAVNAMSKRQWVGLTEEEWLSLGCNSVEEVRIGLAIQAKLKGKNCADH